MITDDAWIEGMADLVACCSSADLTPEMASLRGRRYRQDLAYLTDERWLYAVSVARRKRWFPSIEELQEYATEMPPPESAGLLPEETGSIEERREAARARAKVGLDMIESALRERGLDVRPPVRTMPGPRSEEEIERQKAAIMADAPPTETAPVGAKEE